LATTHYLRGLGITRRSPPSSTADGKEIEVGYIKAWLEQFGIAERWDRGQEEAVRKARS
jgi:hypothetical protein